MDGRSDRYAIEMCPAVRGPASAELWRRFDRYPSQGWYPLDLAFVAKEPAGGYDHFAAQSNPALRLTATSGIRVRGA